MERDQENQPVKKEVRIVDIPVIDENSALNVIVAFLVHAQGKGIFSFEESSKIWECIKIFQRK